MITFRPGSSHTRVKLCEFESLDAAYEASFIGVDALGFHIFQHQDIDAKLQKFAEIFGFLPPTVDKVLLTDLPASTLAERILPRLRLEGIQFYPDAPPEEIRELRKAFPEPFILKLMSAQFEENRLTDPRAFIAEYESCVDGFLLDSFRIGGTGERADWAECARVVQMSPLPVFLAGGLTAQNVGEAIRQVRPFGVDVENGVSDRIPGGPLVKNLGKCRTFVQAVRTADAYVSPC